MIKIQSVMDGVDDHELCVWRIKANEWVTENQAWLYRDFNDENLEPPTVSIRNIEWATEETGLRPILWLEEIDKFSATKSRLDMLNSLIDAVYEKHGLIIVTTNMTRDALRKHIGGASYRRISGENDDPAKFAIWDFYRADMPKKKKP